MKKFTVFGAALLLGTAVNVQAQDVTYPASASTEIFDFTPWDDDQLLVLFAKAADEGRKYPTKEEFEAAGFNLDLEFSRASCRHHGGFRQKHRTRCLSYPSVVDEHSYRSG